MLTARTSKRRPSERNPERTRGALLEAAFRTVHCGGYQGADLDTILEGAGLTKGALYHHFDNKEALGYALVDEILTRITRDKWLRPLESAVNPVDALIAIVESTSLEAEDVRRGCPLDNLSQEMSPLHEGFRKRLRAVFAAWQRGVATALRKGRTRGLVRADVDPGETATFFVALYEGYLSLAKNAQDAGLLRTGKRQMVRYLESLRPTGAGGARRR